MKKLSRYVSRYVVGAILLVLLVVVSLDAIAAIIDGVGDIRGDYNFTEVLIYVATTLPARIYQNIPFSALIGCLIGLGVLAGNSELVVMRAAGVSLLRIVAFVLRPVISFILVGVLIGEYAVPYTDQLAESRKMLLRGDREISAASSGMWNREGREFMHFNAVFPNGKLFGVTRYSFSPDGHIEEVSFASEARYFGDHWLEETGEITRFLGDRTETDTFVTRRWETSLSPDLLNLVILPPESLPIADLYKYSKYLADQGQNANDHILAFWNKALQPATVASLVLIAVSFVFGPLREATMGFRIFSGIVVGIVFRTSQELLGPASMVYGFEPFWSVLAPVLVCVLIGLFLLRRAA